MYCITWPKSWRAISSQSCPADLLLFQSIVFSLLLFILLCFAFNQFNKLEHSKKIPLTEIVSKLLALSIFVNFDTKCFFKRLMCCTVEAICPRMLSVCMLFLTLHKDNWSCILICFSVKLLINTTSRDTFRSITPFETMNSSMAIKYQIAPCMCTKVWNPGNGPTLYVFNRLSYNILCDMSPCIAVQLCTQVMSLVN